MWSYALIVLALVICTCLDDILEFFKKKDPQHQKEQEIRRLEQEVEKQALYQRLKESVGEECQIESPQFYLMSQPGKLTAKILQVDHGLTEQCIIKKRTKQHLIIKVQDITNLSKIL